MTRAWPCRHCKHASSYCIIRVFGLTANDNIIEQVFTVAHDRRIIIQQCAPLFRLSTPTTTIIIIIIIVMYTRAPQQHRNTYHTELGAGCIITVRYYIIILQYNTDIQWRIVIVYTLYILL